MMHLATLFVNCLLGQLCGLDPAGLPFLSFRDGLAVLPPPHPHLFHASNDDKS